MQLTWALSQASERGVEVNARANDLNEMLEKKMHVFKSIYLDDGKTGSDLSRQGYCRLLDDATANESVTHVFVYKRDRLARPESAVEAMRLEDRLGQAGVTLVLEGQVLPPRTRGKRDVGRELQALIDYNSSGEFLETLAERIVRSHETIARSGLSTGGNPPYGFVRALYGPDDSFVELLPPGRTVRQDGHHVRWIPGQDDESKAKLKVWLLILALHKRGWSAKRISNHLNELHIPSPNAGKTRTDNRVQHRVSDKWNHRTVLELIDNPLIAGRKTYAKRASGKHRRHGAQGPRTLQESEWAKDGRAIIRRNDSSLTVDAPSGGDELYAPDAWEALRQHREQRGHSQRGVPRAKDPSKYPLSCRVIDLTDNCGAIMHGIPAGGRLLYKCSRYMKSSGRDCSSNSVDAEALVKFVSSTLSKFSSKLGSQAAIRKRLDEIANAAIDNAQPSDAIALAELDRQVCELQRQRDAVQRNFATETDPEVYEVLKTEFLNIKEELEAARTKRGKTASISARVRSLPIDEQVEQAMSLLGNLECVLSDAEARVAFRELMERLNVRVGLYFSDAIKGKKRIVRRLTGGVIAFGEAELPVPTYGCDAVNDASGFSAATQQISGESRRQDGATDRQSEHGLQSAADSVDPRSHVEETSITKGSRADRI
ncbi:MAG: recombinase family protein [Planctomycetota bacterium]